MSRLKRALQLGSTAVLLFLLCVAGATAADLGAGTVTADALRLRAGAGTDTAILATAAKGEAVVVLADAGNGWYKVNYKSVEGYMSGEYLEVAGKADADLGYGKVTTGGSTLNVRSGPGTGYDRVTILNDGAVVTLTGVDSGWYKVSVNGVSGYASGDYVVPCSALEDLADGTTPLSSSPLGQQIVDYAKQFLGVRYVWGGNGPNGFDCSGFTKYVYAHFGYTLNRTASGQLSNGVSVSRSELQPGDLIFFDNGKVSTPVSHVAIYIGNGRFIHASTNSYTVEIDSLNEAHNSQKYVYARRII